MQCKGAVKKSVKNSKFYSLFLQDKDGQIPKF